MILLFVMSFAVPGVAEPIDFNRDVLPILTSNCFPCHGPDAGKRKADLRLDLRASAVDELAPGHPEQSEVLARITAEDGDGRMPPPKSGPRLKAEHVALLRT